MKEVDFTTLNVASVSEESVVLKDIAYNCPVCDYGIELNLILTTPEFVVCENCNHKIKLIIKLV